MSAPVVETDSQLRWAALQLAHSAATDEATTSGILYNANEYYKFLKGEANE